MTRSLLVASLITAIPFASSAQEEFPTSSAKSQDISPEVLQELADEMRGYQEGGLVVGAELVVIKNRHVVLHEVVGWRDRERKLPMERGTIFNIRSMTKTLTGAAAQILIDEGELALDDLVADYLPGFEKAGSDTITVEQLLTHRGGLPLTAITESIDQYEDLYTLANAVGERGPQFPPGSKYWYSDAGTDTLGAIVEEVSGMSLDEFVGERLLEPLGMTDSLYVTDLEDPRCDRIASLYIGGGRKFNKFWEPTEAPFYPYAWGSQTLYATPLDYARFLCMWMDRGRVGDEQILSEEACVRALTPVSPMKSLGSDQPFPVLLTGVDVYYGQMAVLHIPSGDDQDRTPVAIGHSGSDGTIAWAFPEHDLIVLYFTQSRGGVSTLRLERTVDRLIHPEGVPTDPAVLARCQPFLGRYRAEFKAMKGEIFEILLLGDRLAIDIPVQIPLVLDGPDEDGKWVSPLDANLVVSFVTDEKGTVTAMKLGTEVLPRVKPGE